MRVFQQREDGRALVNPSNSAINAAIVCSFARSGPFQRRVSPVAGDRQQGGEQGALSSASKPERAINASSLSSREPDVFAARKARRAPHLPLIA